jgi:hypothetical protein
MNQSRRGSMDGDISVHHPLISYLVRERLETSEQPQDAAQRYVDCVNAYLDEEFFCYQVDRCLFGAVCRCGWRMDEVPGVELSEAAIHRFVGKLLRHYEMRHAKRSAGGMVTTLTLLIS